MKYMAVTNGVCAGGGPVERMAERLEDGFECCQDEM
jgi:hypothetical protein